MRKYVSCKTLKSIYFAIFHSYLSYCCLVWAQNCSTIQQIYSYFTKISILKFQDKICPENTLFISKSLSNFSPSVFNTCFSFSSDQHNYETSSSTQIFYKTNKYWKYSTTVSAVELWNKIQKQLKNILLKDLPPNKTKTVVSNFYFKSC